ncbi:MAG: hypothetical protein E6J00_05790 [Chloroflexi bacterium]|nr:MAG: hypothetical protein E6J00_05790 [Chloroflexota bacterium]
MPEPVVRRVGETLTLNLTGITKREDNQWTAWCPEVDIAAQADSEREAIDALVAAVSEYVDHMVEGGRESEIVRPAPPEAYHEFLTPSAEDGEVKDEFVQVSGRPLVLTA